MAGGEEIGLSACSHIVNSRRVKYNVSIMETGDMACMLYHEPLLMRRQDTIRMMQRPSMTPIVLDRMKYREKWWVIDIGGNNLRMMFFADFERGKIFVKHITTHAEYDRLTKYYREHKE
ncbi:mRNA interferase HigB [Thelohanellus kitauei]|uniref:mRNA interferase HigB n=1 Tax=Thelohanellus kitauei TaxID=669202 RepID=A0A0C2M098_THEKT|nr:mRNA interferase HigB [Thelohanellus kitauei]